MQRRPLTNQFLEDLFIEAYAKIEPPIIKNNTPNSPWYSTITDVLGKLVFTDVNCKSIEVIDKVIFFSDREKNPRFYLQIERETPSANRIYYIEICFEGGRYRGHFMDSNTIELFEDIKMEGSV